MNSTREKVSHALDVISTFCYNDAGMLTHHPSSAEFLKALPVLTSVLLHAKHNPKLIQPLLWTQATLREAAEVVRSFTYPGYVFPYILEEFSQLWFSRALQEELLQHRQERHLVLCERRSISIADSLCIWLSAHDISSSIELLDERQQTRREFRPGHATIFILKNEYDIVNLPNLLEQFEDAATIRAHSLYPVAKVYRDYLEARFNVIFEPTILSNTPVE